MGIINRELDPSEKRKEIALRVSGTVSGASHQLLAVPFDCKVVGAYQAAHGLSGSPVHTLVAERFIVGLGSTVIGGWASTLTVSAYGTSGAQGYSCASASFISLNAGDVIALYPSGSNAAVANLAISLVVECINDIKKSFSVPAL
jgi:hypothetical protein